MIKKERMKEKLLLYIVTVVVCVLSVWVVVKEYSADGLAYVDIGRLIDNYALKKDLEASASKDLYKIKNVIDSLEMLRKTMKTTTAIGVDSQLARAKYVFEQYYKESNTEINKEIWNRLNPVIERFGKENDLELLIGANGAGTLLYANSDRDVTDQLIEYVNGKYEKGN